MRRSTLLTLALSLLLPLSAFAADPVPALAPEAPIRVESPSTLKSTGGAILSLPPGYFFSDPVFGNLDVEMRRLQGVEVGLTAENSSLRTTAKAAPGTARVVLVSVLCFAVGAVLAGSIVGIAVKASSPAAALMK